MGPWFATARVKESLGKYLVRERQDFFKSLYPILIKKNVKERLNAI